MKKIAQLALLAFVVVGISACGKMGELEAVKAQQVTLSPAPVNTQAIDETTQAVAPELDILPHNSK
ncbi:MAG: hypothetical protein ISR70_01540 [Candidatus Thioglobus sp.]|nr:hypothetical protein [Candidatus Thioglobus pontius]MBL6976726.1 hypothetical protein [Candidatus Thioglobus sp.]MBL6984368.1 hypothetical protein [Candidatus Thioglobus sp.]